MLKTNQLNYIIRLWLDVVVLLACFALACFIEIGSLTGIFKPPLVVILSSSLVVWYFGARILLLYREMILFSFSQEMTVFLKQLLLHLLVLIFLLFIFLPGLLSIPLFHPGIPCPYSFGASLRKIFLQVNCCLCKEAI